MGGGGAAEGGPALELPQISDRPGRLYRRSVPGERRTGGYAGENRYCARLGRFLTPAINRSGDKFIECVLSDVGGAAPTRVMSPWGGKCPGRQKAAAGHQEKL